jgi:hypothetical protein
MYNVVEGKCKVYTATLQSKLQCRRMQEAVVYKMCNIKYMYTGLNKNYLRPISAFEICRWFCVLCTERSPDI